MNRRSYLKLALLVSLLSAGAVRAASPAKEPVAVPDGPVAGGPAVETPAPVSNTRVVDRSRLAPMHREILDAVESERAQVEELSLRYSRAVLPAEKIAIQKEIETIKKNGMIAVYEIQLRYARAAGREETVRQMEAAIEAIRNPKPAQGQVKRLLERP
jgi:hypothetical protein